MTGIVAINTRTEYGKMGQAGVNIISELSDDGSIVYAHSMDEALSWLKQQPIYAEAEPESLGDGRQRIVTDWKEGARHEVVIYPVNTVFVHTGYGVHFPRGY